MQANTQTVPQGNAVAPLRPNRTEYRRVPKFAKEEIPEEEIRVASGGRITNYVTYAARLFTDRNRDTVCIRATGKAVAIALSVAEILHRRFEGLHQLIEVDLSRIEDEYKPEDEGKPSLTVCRSVPVITITLTKDGNKLDKNAKGYQGPLPSALVEQLDANEIKRPSGRGRRRGPRGARGGGRGGRGSRGRTGSDSNNNSSGGNTRSNADGGNHDQINVPAAAGGANPQH